MGHSTRRKTAAELEALKPFATANQLECLEALLEHGSYRQAAKAIGKNAGSFNSALRTVMKRALQSAARGPSTNPRIPAGHELSGLSTLRDLTTGEALKAWEKTRVAGAIEPPTDPQPPGFLLGRVSTMRRGDGSTVIQWTSADREKAAQWEECKAAIVQHVATYVKPAEPTPLAEPPGGFDEERLVAYPLGDPHIGMLAWADEVGESFDLKIAERELCECFRQLVARSPRTRRAIVCNLGDFWHAQDDNQQTPRGKNKLDVDGRSGKVGEVGLRIMRTIVDTALVHHDEVLVRSVPGNHDPQSAFWLPQVMRAEYRREPRVTVEDAFNPYQYDVFGKVLLGWAHGDGAKLQDLGGLMATDVRELWGKASFCYWNVGHVHHWSQKELPGVYVDTHRTLAGRDAWHHHAGYRSMRALKAPVYHQDWGLDSVAVVGVERVRAALQVAA